MGFPSPSLRQSGVLDVPQFAHSWTVGVGGDDADSCVSCDGRCWWWKMFSLRNWWDGEGGCGGCCCCCSSIWGLLKWIGGDSRTTGDMVYATVTRVEDGCVASREASR